MCEKQEQCMVQLSPELAKLCRPYYGCPRGAIGVPYREEKDAFGVIKDTLVENRKYILQAQDDKFICIPSLQYEQILNIATKMSNQK